MARLLQLTSLDAVRQHAEEWDDLWQRSDVSSPMTRAELVALWGEQFAPKAAFHALVVEDRGRWLAALPLFGNRVLRTVSAGAIPANSWVAGGSFLLDANCHIASVMKLLVQGLFATEWQLFWLDEIQLNATYWRRFEEACRDAGMTTSRLTRYAVGRIAIGDDWQTYFRRLSRPFRKNLRRSYGRLEHYEDFAFKVQNRLDLSEVEAAVRRGFTVEHRSWKGRAGSSVIAAGLLPFYVRQASQLAQWGQLQLGFLEISQQPVAFVYAAVGKGVYHSYKVGYNDEFSRCSPGLLLEQYVYQRLWNDSRFRAIDLIGVFTEAERHWRPVTYQIGRIVVSAGGRVAPAIVYLHDHYWPMMRRLRRRLRGLPQSVASLENECDTAEDEDQLSLPVREIQR